jgi:DNA-binding MarR family transcriptional regulator
MGGLIENPRWLAWYKQAKMNARLMESMSDVMERETGLPAAWFDVLANLKLKGPTRMNELADELVVSRGGATRLVARMEEAGLVEREIPPHDRRATFAVITEAGIEAFERAKPVHLRLVEEAYGRHLEPEDVESVLRVAVRVSEAHGWPVIAKDVKPPPDPRLPPRAS